MKNFINYIHISNFKSIRDLKLDDCRRINLFIGYPNVGKSNVLEALSLFSVPFLDNGENINKLIRVENKNELFYNASDKFCSIDTNLAKILLDASPSLKFFLKPENNERNYQFSKNLVLEGCDFDNYEEFWQLSTILRYIFRPKNQWISFSEEFLLPPFGENIIDVLSYNENVSGLKTWMKRELARYGLEYILDKSSNSLKIQRRLGNDEVFQLPYSSIAETLQRIIFYKTAISSNRDAVLLFEEPEAHAFPPYIKTITQDIIDSISNQFFIVTHSPVILNSFIEYADTRKEVAIYLLDFKDGQTTAKHLSDEELDDVYNYGEDLFFSLENFL
jgi:AAA15 family ATPase/GTPase